MTKFKYNYLNNQLSRIDPTNPEYSYQIEDQFEGNFGAAGFILGESNWITFTVYEKKIKVFAKFSQDGEIQSIPRGQIIYYRKEITIIPLSQMPLSVPNFARQITFEFTEEDIVIKNEKGHWIPKNGS